MEIFGSKDSGRWCSILKRSGLFHFHLPLNSKASLGPLRIHAKSGGPIYLEWLFGTYYIFQPKYLGYGRSRPSVELDSPVRMPAFSCTKSDSTWRPSLYLAPFRRSMNERIARQQRTRSQTVWIASRIDAFQIPQTKSWKTKRSLSINCNQHFQSFTSSNLVRRMVPGQ